MDACRIHIDSRCIGCPAIQNAKIQSSQYLTSAFQSEASNEPRACLLHRPRPRLSRWTRWIMACEIRHSCQRSTPCTRSQATIAVICFPHQWTSPGPPEPQNINKPPSNVCRDTLASCRRSTQLTTPGGGQEEPGAPSESPCA